MFTVLISMINVVHAVYFTMSDIRMTVPSDRGKFLPENHPLITFHAQSNDTMRFSIEDKTRSLQIFPPAGDVMFTRKFLNGNKAPDGINSSITVEDGIGQYDRTTLEISILHLNPLDCDYFVEDLCYWQSAKYRIYENAPPTLIGSLASPYLSDMCPGYELNYNIMENDDFALIRTPIWSLRSKRPIDRDVNEIRQAINITCTVKNPQNNVKTVANTIQVVVLDLDDNPPEAQTKEIKVNMSSNVVVKGHAIEPQDLIFLDKDTVDVNMYEVTILGDTLNFLQPHCKKYPYDYAGAQNETAVHCKLNFTKSLQIPNSTYSVTLQLNDTTLITGNKVVRVPIQFLFLNDTGHHPALLKKKEKTLHLYPSNKVKVFRTAAPLARITQPDPERLKDAKKFLLNTTTSDLQDIFNVTYTGGIVFVHDTYKLSRAPESLRLNISWIRNNKREFDVIDVRIVVESRQTCVNMSQVSIHEWEWCSKYDRPSKCLNPDTCAISTGGSSSVDRSSRQGPRRCMWRGDKNPGKEITHLYATCTPDVDTCPDGICDPLELLYDKICPQDCTTSVAWPTNKNLITGRGIDSASGVCVCGDITCHCHPISQKKEKKGDAAPQAVNHTEFLQGNVSRHTGNLTVTGRVLGVELSRCGTTCVLGIVAGVLFLAGAACMVVVWWHLDRVHKATRGKFGDDNQDLSMPLSDYIDRTAPPDPLRLRFDMTTSLADTAVLNIINKYAPDPKWEFPRNQLVIEQTLGEGEFGRVLRAKAMNIAAQPGYTTVAVKTLKDDARETELNDLLSEYQLLKEVCHPNIIRLLGVCTAPGGPIYLIIEFAEHGSLRNYLRRSRHLKSETWRLPSSTGLDEDETHYDEPVVSQVTPKEILSFAWQICKGMAHLSEIKLVHRDLAARNVLLAADKICKISDFGLTRDIYEDDAYFKRSKGRVKWMAPESLSDHIYTNKSDVWSFGILVWELVTLGATPYPGIAVQNLFHLLRQGYRMERPDNCSPTLYNIMRSCWHIEPEQRPTFQELSALWEKMLSDEVEYLDLTNNAIHNRSYFCAPFDDKSSEPSEKSDTNPLNYLTKSLSYVKCGSADKFQDSTIVNEQDTNQNDINTQGYETPVKVAKKMQTPTNDCPQYYTDMAAGKAN